MIGIGCAARHTAQRRMLVWGAALLLGGLLAACASVLGPRRVALPLERLQQAVERRFPIEQRPLGIFQIRLSHPRLSLLADSGRVAIGMDAWLASPLMKQPLQGELALSGQLGIDAAHRAVVISGARVEHFAIAGLDRETQGQLAGIANAVAASVVREDVLYRWRPEQLRYAGVQFLPRDIVVTPSGLEVTLAPAGDCPSGTSPPC